MELDEIVVSHEAFHGDFIAEPGHHNLAIFGLAGALHRQQIAIHDAGIAHGHAAHFEQVVWLALEQAVFDVIGFVDVLLRQNGGAGCHPANQGQCQLARKICHRLHQRFAARSVDGLQSVAFQADAARGAADQFDRALAGQRLEMFLGRVGGFEAELGGNFCARGRGPGAGNGALDKIEDLLLAISQFGSD